MKMMEEKNDVKFASEERFDSSRKSKGGKKMDSFFSNRAPTTKMCETIVFNSKSDLQHESNHNIWHSFFVEGNNSESTHGEDVSSIQDNIHTQNFFKKCDADGANHHGELYYSDSKILLDARFNEEESATNSSSTYWCTEEHQRCSFAAVDHVTELLLLGRIKKIGKQGHET